MAVRPLRGPFTVADFHRLAQVGVLHEEDRVELVDGQVVEMSPIGEPHAACVRRLNRLLSRHLSDVALVDVQNPIVLGPRDQPQPDLVLLRPRADGYPHHPRSPEILLVIEVADTTLAYDRDVKVPLYARAGISEAWLVDLDGAQIEVYREPAPEGYRDVRTVGGDGTLSFSGIVVRAGEVLG